MPITARDTLYFLQRAAAKMNQHRDELTRLDSPIGDADHGVNLDRGFVAVMSKLPEMAAHDIGTILKTTGMTLISTVGGTSGPLYGTAFMRAAALVPDRYELHERELVVLLEAALQGIQKRGRAHPGEKTMIDTIAPCLNALQSEFDESVPLLQRFRRATAAAEDGMRATIPMLAKKGRASYLGERSIGHQDPGATSAFYLVQAMLETLEAREQQD